jgi:hypothetical protein
MFMDMDEVERNIDRAISASENTIYEQLYTEQIDLVFERALERKETKTVSLKRLFHQIEESS